MDPETKKLIDSLVKRIQDLEKYVDARKIQQISFPIDDVSRKTMGLGFIGTKRTDATTASGYVTVNSNNGPIKVLIV